MTPTSNYWEYLWKSAKWFGGNVVFGLIPFIFMGFMYFMSSGKLGRTQIDGFIHEGAILFVLSALMGSIMWDYWLGPYKFSGWEIFHIFIIPFSVIAVLCLNYLLICLTILDETRFDITSYTSTFCYVTSVGYCLFQKLNLFIREDSIREIHKQQNKP